MTTFKEQLDNRTRTQHELAVYEALYQWLDESFIPRDGRAQSTKAIRVPDCMTEIVPQDCIEDVLKDLAEGPIAKLRAALEQIESQPMTVGKEKKTNG